ncbi:TetR/AcrR family transcriptional regulator [Streptomyces catenulae]|uniref:TetR/AcrR family transcriptional regulator n=1 Tax=Streptomyces catenulae TaxID=66875 RepID=A0ABV2YVJ7_9ACTN|nr:TetR/AcrR family transcriptional regulator [Streptomyces catenulae]
MPTAREALLDAAYAALADHPWSAVRMVDVAAAARVSRQTLYNEFGSKSGLARALVRREVDAYLAGVERALTGRQGEPGGPPVRAGAPPGRSGAPPAPAGDAAARVAAAAAWTLRAARANPLVRAALTGCWGERLPPRWAAGPPPRPRGVRRSVPAQRQGAGEGPPPGPADLVGRFRERAVAALAPHWPDEELPALDTACEAAARLTLSCVVAPDRPEPPGAGARTGAAGRDAESEAVARLVRGAFARVPGRSGRPGYPETGG